MHWPLDIKLTIFNGLLVDCPPGGKALIFDLDHRNGQVLNLVMGEKQTKAWLNYLNLSHKETKIILSILSKKDSQIHFAVNGKCFLECFFHTPILLLRKVTASKSII